MQYDIVLVWIHPEEILPYYDKHNIDYYLCFPSKEALIEYRDKFINRGNNLEYINELLEDYLDIFTFTFSEFEHKFNELNKKYNNNLINSIKDDMNILEKFYL